MEYFPTQVDEGDNGAEQTFVQPAPELKKKNESPSFELPKSDEELLRLLNEKAVEVKTKDGSIIRISPDLGKMTIKKAINLMRKISDVDKETEIDFWRLPQNSGSLSETEDIIKNIELTDDSYFCGYDLHDMSSDEDIVVSLFKGKSGGSFWDEGESPKARVVLVKSKEVSPAKKELLEEKRWKNQSSNLHPRHRHRP